MSKDSRQHVDAKTERAQRLADALRENLKRRKAAPGDSQSGAGQTETGEKPRS